MQGCAPDDPAPRPRRTAHLRPHGGRHDLARAIAACPARWVAARRQRVSATKSPATCWAFSFGLADTPLRLRSAMKHFLNTQDWSRPDLDALLAQAAEFRRAPRSSVLQGKSIALVFFNPSLRTRTSFELGAFHLGAHAVVLQPGKDAWPIEFESGAIMDGDAEEHVSEVARVLSRYVDMIGVRAFPKFQDWQA